jgi:pimeloyl-ACP methyl ester carboxylesterase
VEFFHRARYLRGPAPVFYEELGPAGAGHPILVLVHGGGFSGSAFFATPDGRPGWAYDFVRRGYRVVIPDWPGVGRSASASPDDVCGQTVAQALGELLDHLGQEAVLLVHSMSGPYGFRVLETHGHLIRALVAVAPEPPGNIKPVAGDIRPVAGVVRQDRTELEASLAIPRTGTWRPTREWVLSTLIGTSTRLDPRHVDGLMAQTAPVPVKILMGRGNARDTPQLTVTRRENFAGKPVLVLTGANDADHPREADLAIVEWLRDLGALAEHCFLGDERIDGNGHMLMSEDNSSQIADIVTEWLESKRALTDSRISNDGERVRHGA